MAAECGPKGSTFRFAGTINEEEIRLLKLGFSKQIDRTADLSPIFTRLDREYEGEVKKQFQSEGSHSGFPWPRLSMSTRKERARLGYGASGPILVRTGDLKKSLTQRGDINAIRTITPRMWVYGTKVGYGIFHQSRAPRMRLPFRPFLVVTRNFRLFVVRRFHEFIIKGRVL